jgi:hypothetical protein
MGHKDSLIRMDIMESLSDDELQETELKELKVKLPLRHHIRLHSLKLVRKEPISDTVMKALTEYFERLEAEHLEEVADDNAQQ